MGAAVGAWIYCARYHLPYLRLLDLAAIAAPLGQAIGRVGNVINGDLPGAFTNGFGVEYTNPLNPSSRPTTSTRRPSRWPCWRSSSTCSCSPRSSSPAAATATGCARVSWPASTSSLYASVRLFLSALDTTPVVAAGLKSMQLAALVGVAIGVWLVVSRHHQQEMAPARAT